MFFEQLIIIVVKTYWQQIKREVKLVVLWEKENCNLVVKYENQ